MSRIPEKKHISQNNQNISRMPAVILVTAVCMLLFMLNNGIRSNFGLIATALHAHTGLPENNILHAVAAAQLLYGLSQPFFGILALKKSNAFVLGLGGILMGVGLVWIPACQNAVSLYLSLGVLIGLAAGALAFGVVMGAASPVLGPRYAAAASGIINGGGGLGGAVLAPYLQSMDNAGLFYPGMIGLACAAGCAVLLCVWLGKKERSGEPEKVSEEPSPAIREMLAEAFTSARFMRLALSFFTCGFFMAIIETGLYPQLISYGFTGNETAFFFTIYGIMGTVGPIVAGLCCCKIHPKWVLGTIYGTRPILVLCFLVLPKTRLLMYGFAVAVGLIASPSVPPTTLLITRYFGSRRMPTLSGIAMIFHQLGSFSSTWLSGVFLGLTGSYTIIWLCGAGLAAAAAVLCYTIRDGRKNPCRQS